MLMLESVMISGSLVLWTMELCLRLLKINACSAVGPYQYFDSLVYVLSFTDDQHAYGRFVKLVLNGIHICHRINNFRSTSH